MKGFIISKEKGLANTTSKALPENWFKNTLWQLFHKYITNKALEKVVERSEFKSGVLHLELKNGLKFQVPPSTQNRKLWRRYEKSDWKDKEVELQIFWESFMRLVEHFVEGIYERNHQVQEGDIVIDVGAAWGINTVDFSRKVGAIGKVIAIEPDEGSVAVLKKNLELNRCKNVTVVKSGVWSRRDKIKFYLNESSGESSMVITNGKVTEIVEVEVDTLDNILEDLGMNRVTLIKMDTEGAEIEALKGMDKILSEDGVKLAIASYHRVDGKPTYKTIIPIMEQKGFSLKYKDGISYFAK